MHLQVWIVLELCTGGTLKDAVAAGKLGVSNRMETVRLCALRVVASSTICKSCQLVLCGTLV